MSFEEWIKSHGFFHENSAREAFKPIWDAMSLGMTNSVVVDLLDRMVAAMHNEYGE